MTIDRETWLFLVENSYEAALARVDALVQAGNISQAVEGLACLMEAMSQSEVREARSKLRLLAVHVYKMLISPNDTALRHWAGEIESWRDDLNDLVDKRPSLRAKLPAMVDSKLLASALTTALLRMGHDPRATKAKLPELSYQDLMEKNWLDG